MLELLEDEVSNMIKCDDLTTDYNNWAARNHVIQLQPNVIGKLVRRFLAVGHTTQTKKGKTTKYYTGIQLLQSPRMNLLPGALVLPDFMTINQLGQMLNIAVSTPYLIDDEPLYLQVAFDMTTGKYEFYLGYNRLDVVKYGLSGYSYLDQTFIKLICRFARQAKLCIGKPAFPGKLDKSSMSIKFELTKTYHDGTTFHYVAFSRVKHSLCKGLANVIGSASTITCRPCQHKINGNYINHEAKTQISSELIAPRDDDISQQIRLHGEVPSFTAEEIAAEQAQYALAAGAQAASGAEAAAGAPTDGSQTVNDRVLSDMLGADNLSEIAGDAALEVNHLTDHVLLINMLFGYCNKSCDTY